MSSQSTITCANCGIRLSEKSMKFHRQVCGNTQRAQCKHCGKRFDPDALRVHEETCGDSGTVGGAPPKPRFSSPTKQPQEERIQSSAPQPTDEAISTTTSSKAAATQARREEMRRNLNSLRAEVYGKPNTDASVALEVRDQHDHYSHSRSGVAEETALLRHKTPTKATTASATPSRCIDTPPTSISTPSRTEQRRQQQPPPPSSASALREQLHVHHHHRGGHHHDTNAAVVPSSSVLEQELHSVHLNVEQQARRLEQVEHGIMKLTTSVNEQRALVTEQRDRDEHKRQLVEEDIVTLGKHVDALRDEVSGVKKEQRSFSNQLRIVQDAQSNEQNCQGGDEKSRREVAQLRKQFERMEKEMRSWRDEAIELRKDQDAVVQVRSDLKNVMRELDEVQGQVRKLHRTSERERNDGNDDSAVTPTSKGRRRGYHTHGYNTAAAATTTPVTTHVVGTTTSTTTAASSPEAATSASRNTTTNRRATRTTPTTPSGGGGGGTWGHGKSPANCKTVSSSPPPQRSSPIQRRTDQQQQPQLWRGGGGGGGVSSSTDGDNSDGASHQLRRPSQGRYSDSEEGYETEDIVSRAVISTIQSSRNRLQQPPQQQLQQHQRAGSSSNNNRALYGISTRSRQEQQQLSPPSKPLTTDSSDFEIERGSSVSSRNGYDQQQRHNLPQQRYHTQLPHEARRGGVGHSDDATAMRHTTTTTGTARISLRGGGGGGGGGGALYY